jgi:UDP-N-acetylglucosamine acyltransferase
VLQDVPPFVTAAGYPAKPHGVNSEGLRRRGFATEDIAAIRRAYKALYRTRLPMDEARASIAAAAAAMPALAILSAFLEMPGRGIIR